MSAYWWAYPAAVALCAVIESVRWAIKRRGRT